MSATALENRNTAYKAAPLSLAEGEQAYLDLLAHVLEYGIKRDDRTGTGTLSSFGHQIRFDLQKGFPLLTTKKVHLRSIIHELLWFLKGDTNVRYLQNNKVSIWDEWADENGDLGPIYGQQWRDFGGETLGTGKGVDQINELVNRLKADPNSRRHMVVAWNPMALSKINKSPPPCHALFQFFVGDGLLSCQLYQRSADLFLGVPFNIASYSLFLMMLAQVCDLKPGQFVHTFGDAHIYLNHVEQVKTQLGRSLYAPPKMALNRARTSLFDFTYDDFTLSDYESHPAISAPIAV
ncbi:MAG TPA: thymidylate synthase [Alphaproteobacteria bacterium]|nr:thymidylate synthase [Alphaproteobacteria bacterium]